MTFMEAEDYVHSFTRFGSQLGLGRMRRFLDRLGNPQKKLKFVHVAGTNGKGSTVKLTASALQRAGYRTGMYISPFVVEFRERYQIDGEMIPKETFARLVEQTAPVVKALAQEGDHITEFEMVTAIGFLYFYEQNCDVVVLEVGIGGRFDATNVIDTPLCAAVTAVSYDHMDILGDTLTQIAGEKAGIVKANTDVVSYPLQESEVLAVLLERCAETGSRLHCPNPSAVSIQEETMSGSRFCYGGDSYVIRLAGRHQIYNAVTVLEILSVLRQKGFALPPEAVQSALAETAFPARFECLGRDPLVILDGGHNLQAVQALVQTLKLIPATPKVAVLGMMKDKDYAGAAALIGAACDAVITVPVLQNPRAMAPEDLARVVKSACQTVRALPDLDDAFQQACSLASPKGMVLICGSFYLASEYRERITGHREKLFGNKKKI